MIAVILATRGLVFTEVEDAIAENLRLYNYKVYRSHDLPIPDSQNALVEEALKENPCYLLFIEEDTVMPKNGFVNLIKANADIAFIDYGVEGWSCAPRKRETGEILWCGLGCTLVSRRVFEKLDKPYFRTDQALRLNDWTWVDVPIEKRYGGQDIWFCSQARKAGYTIVQAKGECRHLRLDAVGQKGINGGLHQISEKPKISKREEL